MESAINKNVHNIQTQKDETSIGLSDIKPLLFSGIALLLAIVAIICFAWGHFSAQTQLKLLGEQVSALKYQVEVNQKLATDISTATKKLTDQQAALKATESTTQKNIDNYNALSQVITLIQFAQYNLVSTQNVSLAISLLELAQTQFASKLAAIPTIKDVLALDLTQLQAVPNVNINQTLAGLDEVKSQVMGLSIQLPSLKSDAAKTAPTDANTSAWQKNLQNSLDTIKSLIIIRHIDQPVKAILTQQQQIYLQQNFQLLVQQAQWAVLNKDQTTYQTSLSNMQSVIATYFNSKLPATQAITKNLTALQAINLQPKLPDLNDTITVLQKTLATMP